MPSLVDPRLFPKVKEPGKRKNKDLIILIHIRVR